MLVWNGSGGRGDSLEIVEHERLVSTKTRPTTSSLLPVELPYCPVCWDGYDHGKRMPRVLHCGHTICQVLFPFIITDWNHAFWNVVFMSCKYLVFASCACSIDVERSRFSFQKKSNFVMGIWETSNALWKAVRRLCSECPMVQAQVMDVQHAESIQKNMPLKKLSVLFLSSLHLSSFSYLLGFYFPLKFFLDSFVISISFMFCWVSQCHGWVFLLLPDLQQKLSMQVIVYTGLYPL